LATQNFEIFLIYPYGELVFCLRLELSSKEHQLTQKAWLVLGFVDLVLYHRKPRSRDLCDPARSNRFWIRLQAHACHIFVGIDV
jgi:hypothetical protein